MGYTRSGRKKGARLSHKARTAQRGGNTPTAPANLKLLTNDSMSATFTWDPGSTANATFFYFRVKETPTSTPIDYYVDGTPFTNTNRDKFVRSASAFITSNLPGVFGGTLRGFYQNNIITFPLIPATSYNSIQLVSFLEKSPYSSSTSAPSNSVEVTTPAANKLYVSLRCGYQRSSDGYLWPNQPGNQNGPKTNSRFNGIYGIAADKDNILYVCDNGNNLIRKVVVDGTSSTFVTGGPTASIISATTQIVTSPYAITFSYNSTWPVYVASNMTDSSNFSGTAIITTIKKISSTGVITLGFTSRSPSNLLVDALTGITVDKNNNVYATSAMRNCVYTINSAGVISIFAGSTAGSTVPLPLGGGAPAGTVGSTDGPAATARFNNLQGITYDPLLNCLYVSDKDNFLIRKITLGATPTVSTLVGLQGTNFDTTNNYYTNGMGSMSLCSAGMRGLTTDSDGNVYITDSVKWTIRKITPAGFMTDHIISGRYTSNAFGGEIVPKTTAPTGNNPSTINNASTTVEVAAPCAICTGQYGMMFYAETQQNAIMAVAPYNTVPTAVTGTTTGTVTSNSVVVTWVGGNSAGANRFIFTPDSPSIVQPNRLFTSKSATITGLLDCTSYTVAVVAINGLGETTGPVSSAFFTPIDTSATLTAEATGFSLSSSTANLVGIQLSWTGLTRVTTLSYTLTPVAGGAPVTVTMPAGQKSPFLITSGFTGGTPYSVTLTGTVTPYTGPAGGGTFTTPPVTVTPLVAAVPLYLRTVAGIRGGGFKLPTNATATPTSNLLGTQLNTVRGIAQDLSGNLYICARTCILRISQPAPTRGLYLYDPSNPSVMPSPIPNPPTVLFPDVTISLFAGSATAGNPSGTQTGAAIRFSNLSEMIYNPRDNCLYLSEVDSSVILKVTLTATPTSTVIASGATIKYPKGLAFTTDGTLYISSFDNSSILQINPAGALSFAVPSSVVGMERAYPGGIARLPDGSFVFACAYDCVIRRYVPSTNTLSIYAGVTQAQWGLTPSPFKDGPAETAQFSAPSGLCADSKGTVYVFDSGNRAIRMITGGQVYTLLGAVAPTMGVIGNTDGLTTVARVGGQNAGGLQSSEDPMNAFSEVPVAKGHTVLFCDPGDNLYLADTLNGTLRLVTPFGPTHSGLSATGALGTSPVFINDIQYNAIRARAAAASSANAQVASSALAQSISGAQASSATAQVASSAIASSATQVMALSAPVADKDIDVAEFQYIKNDLGTYTATIYSAAAAPAEKATALSSLAVRLSDLQVFISNLASSSAQIFAIAPMYQDRLVQFPVAAPYLQSIGSIKLYDAMRKNYITIDSTTGYIIPNVELPSNRPFVFGRSPSGTGVLTLAPTDSVLTGNPTLPTSTTWVAYFDSIARRYFYVNTLSGGAKVSQYDHPFSPVFSPTDQVITDVTTKFLPAGWLKLQSASKNIPYYLNTVSTETLWVHPNPPPDPAASTLVTDTRLLPTYAKYLTSDSGTSGAQTRVSGIPFYVNVSTKEAQWNFPDVAFNVAPSAAQQASSALAQAISGAQESSAVAQVASSAVAQNVSSALAQSISGAQESSAVAQVASSAVAQNVSSALAQRISGAQESSAVAQVASSALVQSISGARQSSAVAQRDSSAQQQAASSAEQQSMLEKAVVVKDEIKVDLNELQEEIVKTTKGIYSSESSTASGSMLASLQSKLVTLHQIKGSLLTSARPILQLSPTYQDSEFQTILEDNIPVPEGQKRVFDTLRNAYIYVDENNQIVPPPVVLYPAVGVSAPR